MSRGAAALDNTSLRLYPNHMTIPLVAIAARVGATPGQVALAWLLRHSPVMLPIPGTGSIAHLEDNCGAALVQLDDPTIAELDRLATG